MSLSSSQFAQLTMLLLARRTTATIADEDDERSSLRKALLVLMALTQETPSLAATDFVHHLVTEFPPLSGHLDHGDHALWDNHTIGVRQNYAGATVLAIKRPVIDALLEEFGNADPEEQQAVIELVASSTAEPEPVVWAMTAHRYVGLFDVMGFSGLVERAGDRHAPTYELLRLLHDAAKNTERMVAIGDDATQRLGRASGPSGQLKILQFSDSILVLTHDASASSSLLVQLAGQAMFLAALHHGVILRGAIACGLMTADLEHALFFGQPLIDAHQLEQRQAWYGIALHPSASLAGRGEELRTDEIPVASSYLVPMKNSAHMELCVINWPVFVSDIGTLDNLLRPFDGTNSAEHAKLKMYHKHTLAFARETWNKYRA